MTIVELIEKLEDLRKQDFCSDDLPVRVSATVYVQGIDLRIEAIAEVRNAVVCQPEKYGKHVRLWGS